MRLIVLGTTAISFLFFYQSCGKDLVSNLGGEDATTFDTLGESDNALDALARQDAETDASEQEKAIARMLAESTQGRCGCPSAPWEADSQEGFLLDATQVTENCTVVGSLASNYVSGDGGCWLRAETVCLAGMSQGIHMRKVWVVGDVIDSGGNRWNFHVANSYDGKVYDAGFRMFGETGQDWRDKFAGPSNTTQLISTHCGAVFGQTGVIDFKGYTKGYLLSVCQAARKFGGQRFVDQVDQWIQDMKQSRFADQVEAGSGCPTAREPGTVAAAVEEAATNAAAVGLTAGGQHLSLDCVYNQFAIALTKLENPANKEFAGQEIVSEGTYGAVLRFNFRDDRGALTTITTVSNAQCENVTVY